jgi:hypothetical protein
METVARGAFERSMRERRDQIRVLFQHGQDPFVGDKPLGPIRELREDRQDACYEVPLLNASYVADIAAGVEAGLYGASFRFRVMREEFVENPANVRANPGFFTTLPAAHRRDPRRTQTHAAQARTHPRSDFADRDARPDQPRRHVRARPDQLRAHRHVRARAALPTRPPPRSRTTRPVLPRRAA